MTKFQIQVCLSPEPTLERLASHLQPLLWASDLSFVERGLEHDVLDQVSAFCRADCEVQPLTFTGSTISVVCGWSISQAGKLGGQT